MLDLWEANNASFNDSLRQQDATMCVTYSDRAYFCLKG